MVGSRYMSEWPRSRNRRGVPVAARRPSTRAILLAKARESLAPQESLRAIADASAQVVSAVSLAAALIAGLSLSGAVAIADVGWAWALPSVIFSALTVILAVWASMPRTDEVRPGDLDDVDRFFTAQIRFRGRLLRASGATLCVAFLCAPIPFIAATGETTPPTLTLTVASQGDDIKVAVDADHIGANAVLSVTAFSDRGVKVLGRSVGSVENGANLEISIPSFGKSLGAIITGNLLEGDVVTLRRSVSLKGFGTNGSHSQQPSGSQP